MEKDMKTTAEKVAVMQAALDGKVIEVSCIDWDKNNHSSWDKLSLEKNTEIIWNWEQNDYRVFVQRFKKVKVYQWIYRRGGARIFSITSGFYKDKSEAICSVGECTDMRPALWTEIEVDVEVK